MDTGVHVVILAAGKGTRMKSPLPKVLHPICGRPLLAWVVDQALSLGPAGITLVVAEDADAVVEVAREAARDVPLSVAVQTQQRGTGDAMRAAAASFGANPDTPDRVVVLYGDMPLLTPGSLTGLVEAQAQAGPGGMALLTAVVDDATGYGRVLRGADGAFQRIVEHKDASDAEREVCEINLGLYAFSSVTLAADLPRLSNDNVQGEFYLTDLCGMAAEAGRGVEVRSLQDPEEGLGINDMTQLAEAQRVLQGRINAEHMRNGVRIDDPATAYIQHGVTIGAGTHILPCCVIAAGVVIGSGCEVGPFSQLRPGTVLEDGAEIGNFTECKNTVMGAGAKAKHLTYLGDTHVGAKANIGAGTIFANYDGKTKHKTQVGERAFIGSGTIVVAPNTIPAGVTTGAGAVVTRGAKIEAGETWIGLPARKHASSKDEK